MFVLGASFGTKFAFLGKLMLSSFGAHLGSFFEAPFEAYFGSKNGPATDRRRYQKHHTMLTVVVYGCLNMFSSSLATAIRLHCLISRASQKVVFFDT